MPIFIISFEDMSRGSICVIEYKADHTNIERIRREVMNKYPFAYDVKIDPVNKGAGKKRGKTK